MGFLFARAKHKIPELTGLQIQTAVNVLPIPIVYGTPRIQMNVIYVNGFRAVAQKAQGGKGLLSGGKGETSGYKYYATFIGALCEGEGAQLLVVFDNQQTYTPSTAPPGKVFQVFSGSASQSPWSVVTTSWPSDAFGYKDTAYIGFYDWPLDSTATIPQLNFMFQGRLYATSPLNLYTAPNGSQYYLDADPGQCIYEFLVNDVYGVEFPVSFIDQDTLLTTSDGFNPLVGDHAVSTYCQAVGLAWSFVLNNPEPASSILERLCKNLVVAPVWTGAVLKFIPYRDTASSTNPNWSAGAGIALKYFVPDIPVLFDLTDDDFLQTEPEDDPVVATRVDVADVKNTVRLDFRDRNNLFNDNVSEAKDENMTELYGPRVERMGTADEFSIIDYANQSVQMQLQRNVAIRNTYTFRLGWWYCILDPMDIVTITDSTLGLMQLPVRIRSIEEDEKGLLTVVAEEFPLGAATGTVYGHQDNTPPTTLQLNIPPPDVNPPLIFEPTADMLYAESQPGPTIRIAVCGGPGGTYDPNWGGANVWISDDNVSYSQIGFLVGSSRMGVTTSTINAYVGPNPQTAQMLGVDLSESNASLESFTPFQAMSGLSLCAIVDADGDFELIGYETATLTGPNQYTLINLYRGLYGTVSCDHLSGAQFCRVDNLVFEALLPANLIGAQLYIKLASFNIFSLELQDLSDCTAYTYTPIGSGANLATNPVVAALLAGQNVNLETANGPPVNFELGGGSGDCAPAGVFINLENS